MKKMIGTIDVLKSVDQRIVCGMKADIQGFKAEQYSSYDSGEMLIDEIDPRNPLKYLTEQERNDLIDI